MHLYPMPIVLFLRTLSFFGVIAYCYGKQVKILDISITFSNPITDYVIRSI